MTIPPRDKLPWTPPKVVDIPASPVTAGTGAPTPNTLEGGTKTAFTTEGATSGPGHVAPS